MPHANRWDKCACGQRLVWDTERDFKAGVVCPTCGRRYRVDCDDQTVYWLEEVVVVKPHRTAAR